jgi:hypothetical protein
MKKIAFILGILVLSFFSCKKADIQPVKEETAINQELSIYGKWLLIGGDMYVEDMDTHVKTKYNHFSTIKTTSSLRYEGALFSIETLTNNATVWEFKQPINNSFYGDFILNNDTLNPYCLYVTTYNMSVTEALNATSSTMQMGGSSLPIEYSTSDFNNGIMDIKVFESFIVINNTNYNYFSILKFKKL